MAGAGSLRRRATFAKRGTASDGAGGTTTAFADQFTVWAGVTHLRGGESVIAARLSGRHPQVVRIRASSQAALITTDWLARIDGEDLNIRDITPAGLYFDLLCEGGVAS